MIWHYDLTSASVNVVLYEISCYIGPPYNGIQLYSEYIPLSASEEGACIELHTTKYVTAT